MSVEDRETAPEELDSEAEFPYLRRQQAIGVRRKRLRLRWLWASLGTAGALLLGASGFLFARFALASPLFTLTPANIFLAEGSRFVSREEVLAALGYSGGLRLEAGLPGQAGANIFRLSTAEIRKQVETIPWVRSATVSRTFPHGLRVQVTEREPVAFVRNDGRLKLIDHEGVLLEKPARAVFDFPVVSGFEAGSAPADRASRLALYAEFQKQTGAEAERAGWLVSEVDLSDADDLKALFVQGQETVQVHFGHSDFSERLRNFLELWPEVHKTVGKVDSMDMRYQRDIVVNPHPQARAHVGTDSGSENPKPGTATRD